MGCLEKSVMCVTLSLLVCLVFSKVSSLILYVVIIVRIEFYGIRLFHGRWVICRRPIELWFQQNIYFAWEILVWILRYCIAVIIVVDGDLSLLQSI